MRASLETDGGIIDIHDMMIAATVISNGGILVTTDIGDFSRILIY
jgi:predicted nucleic acid-binding protein